MNTKDIKSKSIDNSVQKFEVESKTWKTDMRLAIKLGYKVEALNEEQTEYLKKLETERAEKEAKAKVKEDLKKSLLAKASTELKKKKEQLLLVANDLADRILMKAISKEEKDKANAEVDKVNKVKADKIRKDKAIAKRERKAELRNKTIPSLEAIANNKKQQEFLAKAHAVKLEDIQARLEAKEVKQVVDKNVIKQQKKELQAARLEVKKQKYGSRRKPTDRTTKEQRIEAVKAKKAEGKLAYTAEMKKQASEIAADKKGYQARVVNRVEKEDERLARIAERQKLRMDKLFANQLKQQKQTQLDLQRFIESEKARLARKEEKRAKYLTKGGIEIPKVKNKVEPRPCIIPEVKTTIFNTYYLIDAHLENGIIVDNEPFKLTCKPQDLGKRMATYHNGFMKKKEADTYVGIFAYPESDRDHCVYEMIASDKLTINNVLTSRMASQRKSVA